MKMRSVLVTGAAGFIGYHLCQRLLGEGRSVVGIDCLNDYYDPALKEARLARLTGRPGFTFHRLALEDKAAMEQLFAEHSFDGVVNLAAQVGVRYSIENPLAYVTANVVGFAHLLEGCRRATGLKHLVFASSSSVYGANESLPYAEGQSVDHPISLYAATKKADELMAHAYAHLYGFPVTGLRFFTVYGPWGRPDMAVYKFTKAIFEGRPIDVYNQGAMRRDFTYVDDIVEGVVRCLDLPPSPNDPAWDPAVPSPATSHAPFRVYNIGNHAPEGLSEMIDILEETIGKKAVRNLMPLQPGDVLATAADIDLIHAATGFLPKTSLKEGLAAFVAWYREYHRV
ncbi:MAG: NAD-dependent epimerase [Nitrospinae bacterium]|nr:NAD-dependent epimerase [Nitrospinota bacterium]